MTTYDEALQATMAKRELAEALAAAREEQREACARYLRDMFLEVGRRMTETEAVAQVRAAPLTATPLGATIKDLRAAAESAANVTKTLTAELDRIYALPGVRSQGDRSDVPDCVEALIEHQECRITETERRGKEIGLADAAVEIKTLTEENVGLRVKLEARFLSLDAAMDLTRTLTEERDAARNGEAAALAMLEQTRDLHDDALRQAVLHARAATKLSAELETVRDQAAEAFDTAAAAYEELKAERDGLRAAQVRIWDLGYVTGGQTPEGPRDLVPIKMADIEYAVREFAPVKP